MSDGPAKELAAQLGPSVHYEHCDTFSYSDQLALFEAAERLFGRVDIVVGNAGIAHHQDIFAADQDWKQEPSMHEIDINTKGALFTTRIGMGYLRKYGGGDIVLTSSIAGFKEGKGLVTYTASKHAVVGIVRGLHLAATPEKIYVNVVCPWMTSKWSRSVELPIC